jgi:ferrochelatase
LAKELGIGFRRIESLNDDPEFIEAMGDILSKHLEKNESTSKQLLLRCPSCINKRCEETKAFFGK